MVYSLLEYLLLLIHHVSGVHDVFLHVSDERRCDILVRLIDLLLHPFRSFFHHLNFNLNLLHFDFHDLLRFLLHLHHVL